MKSGNRLRSYVLQVRSSTACRKSLQLSGQNLLVGCHLIKSRVIFLILVQQWSQDSDIHLNKIWTAVQIIKRSQTKQRGEYKREVLIWCKLLMDALLLIRNNIIMKRIKEEIKAFLPLQRFWTSKALNNTADPLFSKNMLLISQPACFHFMDMIDAAEIFQLLHLLSPFRHLTLYLHFFISQPRPCMFSPHQVNVYVCVWFYVSCALTGEMAATYWVSDWSPVARSGELCELWCSLTAAFSWKASLWGPAGFQYAHLHIKTAQERDSAQGGWGTARRREGRVMKDALFSLFFFSPQAWAGV